MLGACRSQGPVDVAPLQEAAPRAWRDEIIDLPPDFAPGLPSGSELLFFAPGMFEEGAEDYWSYVFLMAIDEPVPDAERLCEILELYYNGLIAAVAEGAELDVGDDPATVEVKETGRGRFVANDRADRRLRDAAASASYGADSNGDPRRQDSDRGSGKSAARGAPRLGAARGDLARVPFDPSLVDLDLIPNRRPAGASSASIRVEMVKSMSGCPRAMRFEGEER